jgi:uncharacterized iron-regulated membrane protein
MLTPATLKTWCLVHKWTSLICTAFMLLLCITGLPLIFSHEIDHALGYSVDPPAMPETTRRASLDEIVADAQARRPDDPVQFVVGDPDEPHVWFVRLGETIDAPEASAFYTYDARTGEFLHAYPLNQGVMNVLLRLHIDMFAGLPGTLFLGFMGLLLTVSLVSGAVVYGPFMRRLEFGTVRQGRSSRLKWLDLHNLLGIVTLVWFLVVGVTGVINTLSIPIFSQWQSTQLADMTRPYRNEPPLAKSGSAEQALAAARAAEPRMQLSFMAFPGNDFASPHHFVAFMQGTTPWTSKLLKPVLIDSRTSQVVDQHALPWYVTALLLSQPLHFGDYGGMPLKVLWAMLDFVTIIVLGSGLYLWLVRGRGQVEVRIAELERAELTAQARSPA